MAGRYLKLIIMGTKKLKQIIGKGLSLLLVAMGMTLATGCTDDFNVDTTVPEENNLTDSKVEAVVTDTFECYTYPFNSELDYLDDLDVCNLKKSDQYEVYVTIVDAEGNSSDEIQLDVLKSDVIYGKDTDGDGICEGTDISVSAYGYGATWARSFSYVSVSFDPAKGEKLKFRVKPIKDISATAGATLVPSRYNLFATMADSESIEFTVTDNNK